MTGGSTGKPNISLIYSTPQYKKIELNKRGVSFLGRVYCPIKINNKSIKYFLVNGYKKKYSKLSLLYQLKTISICCLTKCVDMWSNKFSFSGLISTHLFLVHEQMSNVWILAHHCQRFTTFPRQLSEHFKFKKKGQKWMLLTVTLITYIFIDVLILSILKLVVET